MAKPTHETYEFAKEVFRTEALINSGLADDHDIDRLEQLGQAARDSQIRANNQD